MFLQVHFVGGVSISVQVFVSQGLVFPPTMFLKSIMWRCGLVTSGWYSRGYGIRGVGTSFLARGQRVFDWLLWSESRILDRYLTFEYIHLRSIP